VLQTPPFYPVQVCEWYITYLKMAVISVDVHPSQSPRDINLKMLKPIYEANLIYTTRW